MHTEVALPKTYEHPQQEASSSSKNESEISLLDILIVLAERKRLIGVVTVSAAVFAMLVSFFLPKKYTATSTILPPQQSSTTSSLLASQLGNLGGMAALAGSSLGIKNPNDMLVGLMKSRTVQEAMVQRFGLMQEYHDRYFSDARKDLEKRMTLDGNSKDGLIRISIEDADPKRAADLVNGYVDQFRKLSESLAITEASQRRLFFERQLEDAKNNLANAEESMKRTEQKTGLIQLDSQARSLIESVASLRAQVAAKEVQIKSLETFATSENAQLVQAQQELDGLRAQLAKLGGSEENPDASLMVPTGKVPEAGLEYVRRLRDVKYFETIFDILARQFEMAKLDEAKQGALIQVVDPAVPPDKRSFPKRGLITIVATILGLFIGICAALFQVGFSNFRKDQESSRKLELFRRALSFSKTR
jgi:tyrosine-protein kinase Etk/Wzc